MPFGEFFASEAKPWEWLMQISAALAGVERHVPQAIPPGVRIEGAVHLDSSLSLPAFCSIKGPAWIGPEVEIRPGAYIRGNVIVGPGSILGNSCEFKNALILDDVQTSHYNYVGDSILGRKAHLGAGVILSNLRLDQQPVRVFAPGGILPTGLRKFGAILGEGAEIGCNAVLNPGSILGKRSIVGPLVSFSGCLEPDQMILNKPQTRKLPRPS